MEDRSPDGRYGTRCEPWQGNTGRDICKVSIYRLIATPERYDRKFVQVMGYLIDIGGEVMLFPEEDRVDVGIPSEAIVILDRLPDEFRPEAAQGIWPFVIEGVFDARFKGRIFTALGALRDIEVIGPVRRLTRSTDPDPMRSP